MKALIESLPELITLQDASKILKVHVNTLRSWDKNGTLKAVRLGKKGTRRYSKKDLLRFINNNSLEVIEEQAGEEEHDQPISWNEDDFRILVETIPQLVWITSPDGYTEYCNRQWYGFTGTTFADVNYGGWEKVIHPDDRKNAHISWSNSLAVVMPYEIEYRIKNGKTGEYRWFLARAIPVRNKSGDVIKWFGTCTDIDEVKRLDQKKDEFIGIASHEMKTPLTSIKAYIQILEKMLKGKVDDKVKLYLQKTVTYADRLNGLISDLLDISKIEAGKIHYRQIVFDIDEIINGAIDTIAPIEEQHTIVRQGSIHCLVSGDKDRLEQVLVNLLTNAVKYSPHANKVIVHARKVNDKAEISVTDFGIGIPKQSQHRLFNRFYRVESSANQFAGLGIGLYISSEIVKRHGGNIRVESEEGKGATFTFAVPLHKSDSSKSKITSMAQI